MANQLIDDEIDLRDYLAVMVKRWMVIVSCALAIAGITLVYNLMQKPVYEAQATILVRLGGSSAVSQYAGFSTILGDSFSSGGGNLGDMTAIIKSRVVAEKVLDDLRLTEKINGWDNPKIDRKSLIGAVQGMLKKPIIEGGLITLSVEFSDKELVADIVNGYLDALSFYWNKLNSTEAKRKTEYIESQLPRVENDLKYAEQKYKQFTLLTKDVGGVEVARLARELEIQNSVYSMLRKEYESSKLEESKEIPPFNVIDKAQKPEGKLKPKTLSNAKTGFLMGLVIGLFLAFFLEYWEKGFSSPANPD